MDDPDQSLPFLRKILSSLRQEVEGKATLIGFVGTPWTLAAYAMEGGADKSLVKTKTIMLQGKNYGRIKASKEKVPFVQCFFIWFYLPSLAYKFIFSQLGLKGEESFLLFRFLLKPWAGRSQLANKGKIGSGFWMHWYYWCVREATQQHVLLDYRTRSAACTLGPFHRSSCCLYMSPD
jgi:hypothetical protein